MTSQKPLQQKAYYRSINDKKNDFVEMFQKYMGNVLGINDESEPDSDLSHLLSVIDSAQCFLFTKEPKSNTVSLG